MRLLSVREFECRNGRRREKAPGNWALGIRTIVQAASLLSAEKTKWRN
jgi:hypothetical protein